MLVWRLLWGIAWCVIGVLAMAAEPSGAVDCAALNPLVANAAVSVDCVSSEPCGKRHCLTSVQGQASGLLVVEVPPESSGFSSMWWLLMLLIVLCVCSCFKKSAK
ncbi:hypothetical protein [Cellvibrio japonicus]|uniref:hypothetical protein n=1 Tax=Cellvibrio japonicus TaxID=155077 RepID=UPI0011D0AA1E|nr:hypothetical protein [Cellvibrio japonicus]QEI13738.1 hypothetical protein FY117_16975 [Cellvibrio japonicus]QEI17312.1 hypothetical protein FY116_16980 [Cellvibrio japonicus]QEI20889.1 hypothetical protein FY115_16975 [Cellvibrio japonicus]